MSEEINEDAPPPSPSLWHENHGSLLLSVMVGVFLVGAIVLIYRQSKVRPPTFPDSSAIQQPREKAQANLNDGSADRVVSIIVIGAANSSGFIRVAIYDSVKTFNDPSKAFRRESLIIVDGQSILRIPHNQLPEKFAIATFHDENDDGELNRNRIGIPIERYGFSQNARGVTGPPAFAEAVVDRSKLEKTLEISIR